MCVCLCVVGAGCISLLTRAGVHKKCTWCPGHGGQPALQVTPWRLAGGAAASPQATGGAAASLQPRLWVSMRGKTFLSPDAQSATGIPGLLFFLPSEGLILLFQSVQKHELVKQRRGHSVLGNPTVDPGLADWCPQTRGLASCSGLQAAARSQEGRPLPLPLVSKPKLILICDSWARMLISWKGGTIRREALTLFPDPRRLSLLRQSFLAPPPSSPWPAGLRPRCPPSPSSTGVLAFPPPGPLQLPTQSCTISSCQALLSHLRVPSCPPGPTLSPQGLSCPQAQLSHSWGPLLSPLSNPGPTLSRLSQRQLTLVPDSDLSQSIPVYLPGCRPQVPRPLAQHCHTWGAVSSLSHLFSCPHGLPGGCLCGQAPPSPCRDCPSFSQRFRSHQGGRSIVSTLPCPGPYILPSP